MPTNLKSLIAVSGPTGAGKSSLAIELARQFSGEVINADSVSVYKGFEVGASAVLPSEMNGVTHHLVGSLCPDEDFSAGSFAKIAGDIISDCSLRKKVPFIVGGTGLYLKALLNGILKLEKIPSEVLDSVQSKEDGAGDRAAEVLYSWLTEVDPDSAEQLHPNDISRIRRALCVSLSTGNSISKLQNEHAYSELNYRALVIILNPDRDELYERINKRVEKMFAEGLVSEVKGLLESCSPGVKPLQSIGYRQVVSHLRGELSEVEAQSLIARDTRRFAKRQMTWWRNEPQKCGWTVIDEKTADINRVIERFLSYQEPFNDDLVWYLNL